MRDRGKGFNEVCKAASTGCGNSPPNGQFQPVRGLGCIRKLQAQSEIDGVFAHNDEILLGAIEAAKAAGRSGIVSVGFDTVNEAVSNQLVAGNSQLIRRQASVQQLSKVNIWAHPSGRAFRSNALFWQPVNRLIANRRGCQRHFRCNPLRMAFRNLLWTEPLLSCRT